jgi:hypothetical protein
VHGVQRGLGQDQHRRAVRGAGRVQAGWRQGRRGQQHHRAATGGGVVAVFGRDGVGLQAEQHVTAAAERSGVAERLLVELRPVGTPRRHTGGPDDKPGVAFLGRQHPDRKSRRVGGRRSGDPVARRIQVDTADSGAILHRSQAYRPGQALAARRGKGLQHNVLHIVTATDADRLRGMRQRAVQPEADVTRVGMRFRRVAGRRIDVDKHIVVLPAQVRHRRVPAQHRRRFTDPRSPGAVDLLPANRIGTGGSQRQRRDHRDDSAHGD